MFVKYKSTLTGVDQVRDVRHFVIRPLDCEEEDKSITHGAVICDGMVERAAFFADALAVFLVDHLPGRATNISVSDTYNQLPDAEELAWFNSWEAAEGVLDKICSTIADGGQFFNLTVFGEDGQTVS